MMANVEAVLEGLLEYYEMTRQIGHTVASLHTYHWFKEIAPNVLEKRPMVLVPTIRDARNLGARDEDALTFQRLANGWVRGKSRPLVADNSAVIELCKTALAALGETWRLKTTLRLLRDEQVALKCHQDELLRERGRLSAQVGDLRIRLEERDELIEKLRGDGK